MAIAEKDGAETGASRRGVFEFTTIAPDARRQLDQLAFDIEFDAARNIAARQANYNRPSERAGYHQC